MCPQMAIWEGLEVRIHKQSHFEKIGHVAVLGFTAWQPPKILWWIHKWLVQQILFECKAPKNVRMDIDVSISSLHTSKWAVRWIHDLSMPSKLMVQVETKTWCFYANKVLVPRTQLPLLPRQSHRELPKEKVYLRKSQISGRKKNNL